MQNFLYQTTSDNQAFEAYKLYIALRNHFSSPTYDFFKYSGRVKASKKSFDKRNDKYFFHKLAERKDRIEFLVSNIVSDNVTWVGDVISNEQCEKTYREFIKYRDSMSYMLSSELDKLDPVFDNNFNVEGGQHPPLLRLFLQSELRLETMTILEALCGYSRVWNRRINDPVVWPTISLKIKKFKPFVLFDQQKIKKLVVDKFKV